MQTSLFEPALALTSGPEIKTVVYAGLSSSGMILSASLLVVPDDHETMPNYAKALAEFHRQNSGYNEVVRTVVIGGSGDTAVVGSLGDEVREAESLFGC